MLGGPIITKAQAATRKVFALKKIVQKRKGHVGQGELSAISKTTR